MGKRGNVEMEVKGHRIADVEDGLVQHEDELLLYFMCRSQLLLPQVGKWVTVR
jgi:hypothetical protein